MKPMIWTSWCGSRSRSRPASRSRGSVVAASDEGGQDAQRALGQQAPGAEQPGLARGGAGRPTRRDRWRRTASARRRPRRAPRRPSASRGRRAAPVDTAATAAEQGGVGGEGPVLLARGGHHEDHEGHERQQLRCAGSRCTGECPWKCRWWPCPPPIAQSVPGAGAPDPPAASRRRADGAGAGRRARRRADHDEHPTTPATPPESRASSTPSSRSRPGVRSLLRVLLGLDEPQPLRDVARGRRGVRRRRSTRRRRAASATDDDQSTQQVRVPMPLMPAPRRG